MDDLDQRDPVLETPPLMLAGIPPEALAVGSMDADGLMGRWLSESGMYGYEAEPVLFSQPSWAPQNAYGVQPNWPVLSPGFLGPWENTPLEVKAMKAYHTQPATAGIPMTAIVPPFTPLRNSFQTLQSPVPLVVQPKQENVSLEALEPAMEYPPSPIASSSGRSIPSPNANIDYPLEENDDFANTMAMEKDGMIWGMKVEQYRALSPKDRKRTRNRISAKHFRLRRKRQFDSLSKNLGNKDEIIERVEQETARLKREVAVLRRRIAMYEGAEAKPGL